MYSSHKGKPDYYPADKKQFRSYMGESKDDYTSGGWNVDSDTSNHKKNFRKLNDQGVYRFKEKKIKKNIGGMRDQEGTASRKESKSNDKYVRDSSSQGAPKFTKSQNFSHPKNTGGTSNSGEKSYKTGSFKTKSINMRKQSDSTGKNNASTSNASSLTGNDPPKAGFVQAQIRKKRSPGKSKSGQAKYKDVMPFTKKYQKGKSVFHEEDA